MPSITTISGHQTRHRLPIAAAIVCAVHVFVVAIPRPAAGQQMIDRSQAVLQALDKITARVSTLTVPVGGTVSFGALSITARACREPQPIEPPESAAFLEILEMRPDEPTATVFTGWMFASSPALSSMQHAVYDILVTDCRDPVPPTADDPSR